MSESPSLSLNRRQPAFVVTNIFMRLLLTLTAFLTLLTSAERARAATFDLNLQIYDMFSQFDANELNILNAAKQRVERMWETVLIGYQPGINVGTMTVDIAPTTTGLASANFVETTNQGGFTLATKGFLSINVNEIENFANWQGPGANGRNYIDELIAHEVGHALGIGTLWATNGAYSFGSFHYTGVHGVAAYRAEFDPLATYVPVENAGGGGTAEAHWDQRMRSSSLEGTPPPADPYLLDPRVGVTDRYGRDRGLELMTGAIDADYGEPFISRTTVQSMRDLGYVVAEFEDFNGDGTVNIADLNILKANYGATGLEIDSMAFGDANRDRVVDGLDFLQWQRAFVAGGGSLSVPEPGAVTVMLVGMAILARAPRRSR